MSYADKIVALDAQGSVCEQGSFAELMTIGGYVSRLAARHTTEADDKPKETVNLTKNVDLDDPARANAVDDLDRPVGDVQTYKYYFAAVGYGNIALSFGLMVLFAFFLQFRGIVNPRNSSLPHEREHD